LLIPDVLADEVRNGVQQCTD